MHARGAGDDASVFFPDVDDFLASFSSLDASSRDDEKAASLADTYFWEDDEDASALRGLSLEARFREGASAALVSRRALATLTRLLRLTPPLHGAGGAGKGTLPKVLLNLAAHAGTRDVILRRLVATLRAAMEATERDATPRRGPSSCGGDARNSASSRRTRRTCSL